MIQFEYLLTFGGNMGRVTVMEVAMTDWKEDLKRSDAARISPKAAEELIEKVVDGETAELTPLYPPLKNG